jgi:hypothetical protein
MFRITDPKTLKAAIRTFHARCDSAKHDDARLLSIAKAIRKAFAKLVLEAKGNHAKEHMDLALTKLVYWMTALVILAEVPAVANDPSRRGGLEGLMAVEQIWALIKRAIPRGTPGAVAYVTTEPTPNNC